MRTTNPIVGSLALCAALAAGLGASAAVAGAFSEEPAPRAAPIDRGPGPGVSARPLAAPASGGQIDTQSAGYVVGGSNAHLVGAFGPPIGWPIVGLHAVLLPDGRVLSFGTDERGKQGARMVFDVWDPALGTGGDAHLVLPNATATDIFCSGQTLLATTGDVVITGGDATHGGKRNYSVDDLSLFRPATNTMSSGNPMTYRRWYPTTLALSNGEVLVLGGREDFGDPATTPEVLTRSGAWRALPGAASEPAFGDQGPIGAKPWFYPRAFVAPNGSVVVLGHDGALFRVATTGSGRTEALPGRTIAGSSSLPTLMFAPGKVLALRHGRQAIVLDMNGAEPVTTRAAGHRLFRTLASGTVLAHGKVAVTGGSRTYNKLDQVAYAVEIWDPVTGRWSVGAAAQKARLYHSTALLLADGTLLTMGGGAPGPVLNLNAEIYYPPYLFVRDGSGTLAPRPTIVAAPTTLRPGIGFTTVVGDGVAIDRVTLVRHGSSTHALNVDQRFINLSFKQSGNQLALTAPANPHVLLPGYYMLFVFDRAGVPSLARTVLVPAIA